MLSYEKIFSRMRNKIDDVKELSLSEDIYNEIQVERLHSVIGNPRVRRLFSSIELDDNVFQINYTLNYSVDEFSDDEFLIELFALGLAIEWLKPKVDSVVHTAAVIGGKEEKKILDNHKIEIDRLDSLERQLKKIIGNYGYMYNSYIAGV